MSDDTAKPDGAEAPNAADAAAQADPAAVAEAVKNALAMQAAQKIDMAPCPCGSLVENLMLSIGQGQVGRATGGCCGIWGVDFLVPRTQDQEIIAKAAAKAWNEAPRPAPVIEPAGEGEAAAA